MYQYPYGDTQQLNLDWIINKIRDLENHVGEHSADVDLEEVANALISLTYSSSTSYNVSDIVYYNGKLYRCNTAISLPGESWNPSHWDEILIGNTLSNVVRAISTLDSDDVYNNSTVTGSKVTDALETLKTSVNDRTKYLYISDMATNTVSALLSSLNTNMASIPNGSSVVRLGNSSNGGRVTLLVNKINNNTASAISTSPYPAIDSLTLNASAGVWSVATTGSSMFDGKTIYIYGDSLSDETSPYTEALQPNWVAHLRQLLPNTTIINRSIAGYTLSQPTNSIWKKINDETDISDADYIIIFGGINDFRHGIELGALFNVTLTNTTFCGSLNMIRNNLLTKAPDADYIFINLPKNRENPYPADNVAYRPAVMYRAAMATFCANNGFTMIDAYNFPMINPSNTTLRAKYQSDGTHFLPAYAALQAQFILNKMISGGDTELVREMIRIPISDMGSTGTTINWAYADFASDGKVTITADGSYSGTTNADKGLLQLPDELCSLTSGIVVCQHRPANNPYQTGYALISTSGLISTRSYVTDTITFRFMVEYNTKFFGYNIYPM